MCLKLRIPDFDYSVPYSVHQTALFKSMGITNIGLKSALNSIKEISMCGVSNLKKCTVRTFWLLQATF